MEDQGERFQLGFHGSVIWQRDKQFGTPWSNHIRQEDLDLAHHLVQILEPFYEFTLQISNGASAQVAEVVVLIDQITASLSTVIANNNDIYPPALQNACRAGICLTNKYYLLTDCSPIYRIAMVLHPSFKDEYFKLAKWPWSWINEALALTREMFDKWYKPRKSDPNVIPPQKVPAKPQTGVLAGLRAAAVARSVDSLSNPVDIWLSGGLVLQDGAPINGLKWWVEQKHLGNTHHGLLQMALDILSCPGEFHIILHVSFGRVIHADYSWFLYSNNCRCRAYLQIRPRLCVHQETQPQCKVSK
ncbi:hypothetical protein PTTG_06262 [Puccinia triticina 1-1 BBBD Race 1]|uniref:Uncharacterized protein n=1 Tax=Puccinia triticina (isolate 1-1 / race 1 (BBBD)) TaxID=630390 RepID=A0A180G3M5_PUCT1|nr:hypothetical protein PTTG_06262 [Puccinia triticina 1-1 BBBD Race 1]